MGLVEPALSGSTNQQSIRRRLLACAAQGRGPHKRLWYKPRGRRSSIPDDLVLPHARGLLPVPAHKQRQRPRGRCRWTLTYTRRCTDRFKEHLQSQLREIREAGLYKTERVISTPQNTRVRVAGGEPVLWLRL